MAEINIQRKRMPLWPWLVGVIVIALLVWLVVDGINKNQTQDNNSRQRGSDTGEVWDGIFDDNNNVSDKDLNDKISDFVVFVGNSESKSCDNISRHPGECLNKLGKALISMAELNSKGLDDEESRYLKNSYKRLINHAGSISGDPVTGFSIELRKAMITAADIMSVIQEKVYPAREPETREVSLAAESIDINRPAQDQQSKIDRFFKASGTALKNMTGARFGNQVIKAGTIDGVAN